MRCAKNIDGVRKIINHAKKMGKKIGLVPTMGYLHEGHLSLVRLARKNCQFLVISIFVNPTQFGPHEDFMRYPRDLKRDLRLLKKEGVDLVFCPDTKEMYPKSYKTFVEVKDWSSILCGVARPHHFQGVTTIVLKLFNIVQPDIAVFGGKDYQQAAIIKKMVNDLNMNVKILTGRTLREKDGLAMSSRNTYLKVRERKNAAILYQSLKWVRQVYKNGLCNPVKAIERMSEMIKEKGGKVDYIEAVDKDTLIPVKRLKNGTLVALAVYFGQTRLIDNIVL